MRDRFFQTAAATLGVLGVLSLVWQVFQGWPPDPLRLGFYASQVIVLYIFLSFGFGFGTLAASARAYGKPEPSKGEPLSDF